MKAQSQTNTVTVPGWDGSLRLVAGIAWVLSLVALVSTASAGDLPQTAVVPPGERAVPQIARQLNPTDRYSSDRYISDRFDANRYDARPFQNLPGDSNDFSGRPNQVQCRDGKCRITGPSTRTLRPNYRDIFDVPFGLDPSIEFGTNDGSYEDGGYNDGGYSNGNPQDPYTTPAPGFANIPTALQRIDSRYANPLSVDLGRSASLGTAINLYTEASSLIDTRHVSPLGYEARTAAALEGVALSLESTSFRQAAGLTAGREQITGVQSQLRRFASRPARSSQEAVGQMQQAASLVSRSLNVPEGFVAMEFLHSTIDSLDRFSAIVPSQTAAVVDGEYETAGTLIDGRTAGLDENIVGVGVEMKTDARGALVMGTVEGGPAAQAGLRNGDVITAVDGRPIGGMSLAEVAGMIGGRSGSQVRFTVDRDGRNGTIAMTRRSIYVSSVASVQMVDPAGKVGYARLKQFSANSAKDLQDAMWKLHRQGMKSLVLDLRGNPGGLLTSSIEISDLFLPCGSIVETRGRNADDNTQETAKYSRTWKTPLVVLIDDGSASASEILAAAIQDNERGVVVGRRSYGKGTVQTHFPLRTVSGNFKLTTAKFYSPNGREMAGAGVAPDVNVDGETDWASSTKADRDVRAAIAALADGRPQELAINARRCRR